MKDDKIKNVKTEVKNANLDAKVDIKATVISDTDLAKADMKNQSEDVDSSSDSSSYQIRQPRFNQNIPSNINNQDIESDESEDSENQVDNKQSNNVLQDYLKDNIQNKLRNKLNNKIQEKLNNRKLERTKNNPNQNPNKGNLAEEAEKKATEEAGKKGVEEAGKKGAEEASKKVAEEAAKKAAGNAAAETAGATAAGTAAAGATAAEGAAAAGAAVAAPEILVVVAVVIAILVLLFLVVIVIWAAYSSGETDDSSSNSNLVNNSCNYVLNGEEIKNLKVRLLTCDGSAAIPGESLVDFEKYVLGVTYAEHEDGTTESWKAQALAAKSYALRRPDQMGNSVVKFTEEDGQKILNIRNCTNDQVYCDPDLGCWSDSSTAGGTVYSGYDSSKAWKKPALAENREIRTAVNDVKDKILIGNDNNIYYSAYTSKEQNIWKSLASSGKNYIDILKNTYSAASISTISCTNADVAFGNCTTSTPIKISSGEKFNITSPFGTRIAPTKGASTTHNGIDLAYTIGTPVYTVFDGEVTVSQDSYGSAGKAIVIAHDLNGDGKTDYSTQYFHLSKRLVKKGDKVSGGQKIGEVGSTGVSTGAHLHFGIQKSDNSYINPEPVVNDLKDKKSIFDKAQVCQNTTTKKTNYSGVFPYYNQCDTKWSNHKICDNADYSNGVCVAKETICTSGCGYTSFSMIASGFNNDSLIKPDNVVDFVSKYSSNKNGGAITNEALVNENVLQKYNLTSEILFNDNIKQIKIKDKKEKIVNALESGKAVELLVPGHFVALVNINNGKIQLNDPGRSSNVGTYTIDELLNLFKKQRSNKCSGCSDTQYFQYAVAYSKK